MNICVLIRFEAETSKSSEENSTEAKKQQHNMVNYYEAIKMTC